MKNYCYLLMFFFLCACTSQKKSDVEYATAIYQLLNDEIVTTMPGTLRLAGDFIVWENPFARDYFVHVHEKATGRKVGTMGQVGEGPQEFITGGIKGSCVDNRFFAMDANGKTKGFLSLDSLVQDKEPFVSLTEFELTSRPAMSEYDKNIYIGKTEDGAESYFEAILHNRHLTFGHYPVSKVKQHLGGEIAYNKERGILASSCYRFPYLALYKNDGNSFSVVGEYKSDGSEYEVHDDQLIFDRAVGGIFGICMSKDYVIALQRDRSKDSTDESKVGRDASKCPRTVFLYDYSGNLVKVVDLGIPIMRIAAEEKNNTLYAIGVNPDFVLVKYEL